MHSSAVPFHDASANGETNSGSGIFVAVVQSVKNDEDTFNVLWSDANSIVFNSDSPEASFVASFS